MTHHPGMFFSVLRKGCYDAVFKLKVVEYAESATNRRALQLCSCLFCREVCMAEKIVPALKYSPRKSLDTEINSTCGYYSRKYSNYNKAESISGHCN